MDRVIREEDGRELLNLLAEIVKNDVKEPILARIRIFFENHTNNCEVKKYSSKASSSCCVIDLLKRLDQEELCNVLPLLSHLPASHQEAAVYSIGDYASLKPELLQGLRIFCTQDGVESQVVFPAIELVILSYTRCGVLECDLVEFFTHLLTDFSLPPFVASEDEEIGVCVRRYQREDMLTKLAYQIGSAVVGMPFVAVGLNSRLCIGLMTAFQNLENGDLRKRAAILHVLAKGIQENKFLTQMFTTLLDGFSQSLRSYFLEVVPLVEAEDNVVPQLEAPLLDKKDNVVRSLLYPLFVTLVYSAEVLSRVKEAATNNRLLDLLCKRCEKFAKTEDVERRPKEIHVGVHYAKQLDRLIDDMREYTPANKRRRAN